MTIRRWTLKDALFALCGVGALLLVPLSVETQMPSATVQGPGSIFRD